MEKYFDAKSTVLYMGFYLLFYLFKNGVGIFISSKTKNDTKVTSTPKPKNRLEQLENDIYNMRKEAEMHNTPSEFVTYSKMKRQINKMEKELEILKQQQPMESQHLINQNMPKMEISSLIGINQTTFYLEVLFWLINIILFGFIIKGCFFAFSYEKYKMNVITNYYYNEESNQVEIPLKMILLCESMVLNQIKNFYNSIYNKY